MNEKIYITTNYELFRSISRCKEKRLWWLKNQSQRIHPIVI